MDSNPIRDAIQGIRSNIFKKGDESRIDRLSQVDKIVSKLSNTFINKDFQNYSDVIRKTMTDNIESSDIKGEAVSGLLQSLENAGRIDRYTNSDEIIESIPFCARALDVLADGIISPDNITKEVMQILGSSSLSDDDKEQFENVNAIRDILELDDYVGDAVKETLKYGDHFLEICDYRAEEVPITQMLITESTSASEAENINKLNSNLVLKYTSNKVINESYSKKEDMTDQIIQEKLFESENDEYDGTPYRSIKVNITEYKDVSGIDEDDEYTSTFLNEDISMDDLKHNKKQKEELDKSTLQNIRIIAHDPRRIIKIQSKKFKMNLGYLVIPENSIGLAGGANNGMPGYQSAASGGSAGYGGLGVNSNTLDDLYLNLVHLIKKHIGKQQDLIFDKSELEKILKRAILDIERESGSNLEGLATEINVRYIPPDRLEHFALNNKNFFPYGESIFQKIIFQAKLLIALETAITIRRISDSTDKRLIYIEANSARRVRDQIEGLKNSLKRRKHSVDSFGNISAIPSMITSYEDYYIPQINGKRFVEFDTLPPAVQIQQVVDELKFFRDMIIGGLDVPPSYISTDEGYNNKLALSHESAQFAEKIISFQKTFSKHLRSFVQKIYKLIHDKVISKEIVITFPPPRMIQIEKESEQVDIAVRTIEAYASQGIPKEYLLKKYLPVDWEEIDEIKTREAIENKMSPKTPEEMANDPLMGGGMGMGGMGMGGMGF